MKKLTLLFAVALLFATGLTLNAQLALHPTAAFINPQSNTGSMEIMNTSSDTREIKISFKFGYGDYDSLGRAFMNYKDSVRAAEYSIEPYIRVFPKKLMIPPNQSATIRFMVRGLPQGQDSKLYFARLVASSVPEVPQIDSIGEGKIAAQIIIQTDMIGLVALVKGKNTADLDYQLERTYTDSTHFHLLMNQDITDGITFWGSMKTEVFDANDELVAETSEGLALYYDCKQRISFDKEKFKPGKYKAVIEVHNQRSEIPEKYLPEAFTNKKEFEFEVN